MFRLYYLLPLLVPLALAKGDCLRGIFRPFERSASRLAARPARAVAFVGIVSLFLVIGLTLLTRVPAPFVADEFGYLLLGDTFAHGRLTNPTPPLWRHFETIYEIMRPTYTAKYPPAQGLVLAVGEWMGWPIVGVWISIVMACAATCWMFMAWMPPRWALAGGLLVAFHPKILEWSQNYWGGAVAMAGGALTLGAFRRIAREPRARDAIWMGAGLGIMANSRPFEGFVLAALTFPALMIWCIKVEKFPVAVLVRSVLCPLSAILLLFAAQIGYYNWRVTGNPLLMPFMLYERTYSFAPQFLFSAPWPEPAYLHPMIRKLNENYMRHYRGELQSLGAFAEATGFKLWIVGQAYLWSYLLVVALLGLPWALERSRLLRISGLIGVTFMLAVLTATWVFPHYVAPAASLFFLLVVQSMRSLHAWRVGLRRPGRNIVRGLAVLFVISYFQVAIKMATAGKHSWFFERQEMIDQLSREPWKSLVIVRYDPSHNPNREWIYNPADILGAKVIFARDMGGQNQELVDYFKDRKAWVINADAPDPRPEPYPDSL